MNETSRRRALSPGYGLRRVFGICVCICVQRGARALSAAILAAGCASGSPPDSQGSAEIDEDSAPRAEAPVIFPISSARLDVGEPRQGGSALLTSLAERRIVFVADEDEASVTAIDAEAREELATTPVGGAPSQLLLGRDGVLYAALRDQGAVVGLEWTGRKDGSLKQRS
ncbi:MAG TPA: hypothetical protein VK459_25715, partial [Polyangiaceae bacterium]|nr:hypothetical protein [Polyangiaceae bacterium]